MPRRPRASASVVTLEGPRSNLSYATLPNVLIAVAGAARTFATIFPAMYLRFVQPFAQGHAPLDEPAPDLFFYLKTEDEGNVMEGMTTRYHTRSGAALAASNLSHCASFATNSSSLQSLEDVIRRYNFTRAVLVDGANEFPGEALQARMRNASSFQRPGTWYSRGSFALHSGLQMAFTLKRVAEFVRAQEHIRGVSYQWVVWLRPDLKTSKRPRQQNWRLFNLTNSVYTIGGLRNWTTLRDYGVVVRGSLAASILAGMNETFEEGLLPGASIEDSCLSTNEAVLQYAIQVRSKQHQVRYPITGSLIRPTQSGLPAADAAAQAKAAARAVILARAKIDALREERKAEAKAKLRKARLQQAQQAKARSNAWREGMNSNAEGVT